MDQPSYDEIKHILVLGGHLPCPDDPTLAGYWGGWIYDEGWDDEAIISYRAGLWGPDDPDIANAMAITAYARILSRAGYRVIPVTYPAQRRYLEHYLEVRYR